MQQPTKNLSTDLPAGVLPCPELDGGAAYIGQCVYSSRLWLPLDLDVEHHLYGLVNDRSTLQPRIRYDPRALKKDTDGKILRGEDGKPLRWGDLDVPTIKLMKEHDHHISIPRELVPELFPQIDLLHLDFSPVWSPVDYGSTIKPRNAKQREAWAALSGATNGTLNLACGKGKTVLGLHKIAQRGYPAVILVHNGGLGHQWKDRALEFLDVTEDDIGLVQGNMGKSEFVFIPDTDAALVDEFRRLDHELILAQERLIAMGAGALSVTNRGELIEYFCGALGLDPVSVTGYGKISLRHADLERWAAMDVEEAAVVLSQLEIRRQFKVLRDSIGGGVPAWMRKIVIVMIPSLVNRLDRLPMAFRQRFGTVLYDEAHHLPATTFSKSTDLFFGERYSLTATPTREDELESIMFAHTGGIFYSDMEPEDPATVYIRKLSTTIDLEDEDVAERVLDKRGKWSLGKVHQHLADLEGRNNRLLDSALEALEEGRKILVLVHAEHHPSTLEGMALDRGWGDKYTTCSVTGLTPAADRTAMLASNDITFATIGVAREGLDAPFLDTLFFGTPFSGWNILVQGKGRIERLKKGKKPPIVVIFEDTHIDICKSMIWSLRKKMKNGGIKFHESSR